MGQEHRFDQFTFSQGEVDPKMYSRPDWAGYYTAAQQIRNAQVLPQGGIQRRWGLNIVSNLTNTSGSAPANCDISILLYDNTSTYLLLWEATYVTIFLENLLQVSVAGLPYNGPDIANCRFTQVQNRVIITNPNFPPYQLQRSSNAPANLVGYDPGNEYLQAAVAAGLVQGIIYPVQFATIGTLPTTSPQIYAGRTYFIAMFSPVNFRVYSSSSDAFNDINYYTISAFGALSTIIVQNTWTVTQITYIDVPSYDFNAGYSAITFTPSATSGNSVNLTASATWGPGNAGFTAAFIGGVFQGAGGVIRITAITSPTVAVGNVTTDFPNTTAIPGNICYLGEPAWSAARGYPSLGAFFQNRLVFANSSSLVNGVWLSNINNAYNFDDSETFADNSISWYPGGGASNFIVALTSGRSLIVHTNNGAFSTPLLTEAPVTPNNFTLTEQNKFACQPIQPIFIDNQIIFADTASNIINMIWEITQSAFVTNNISVMSSSLVNSPVDMASFYEPKATDGFYAMIVNSDGTMACFQTLHEQQINAWSLMDTSTPVTIDQQSNYQINAGNFVHVTSGYNRCWVITQRLLPSAVVGNINIVGFSAINSTLNCPAHGIPLNTGYMCYFNAAPQLPASNPQINSTQYWFLRAVDTNNVSIYTTLANANSNTHPLAITSAGMGAFFIYLNNQNQMFIEEVNFNFSMDCAMELTLPAPNTSISGFNYLNGCVVNILGDGYLYNNATVFQGVVTNSAPATDYQIGLNYVTTLQPLPISLPNFFGILYNPVHIRAVYVRYYQTIGAQFQGFGIPVIQMQDVVMGAEPVPQDGVYLYTPMEGWNNQNAQIIVTQPYPLPMTILGFSYVLEA